MITVKAILKKYKISKILDQPVLGLTDKEKEIIDYIHSWFKGIKPFKIGKNPSIYYINSKGKFVFGIIDADEFNSYKFNLFYSKCYAVRCDELWSHLTVNYKISYEDTSYLFKYFIAEALNVKSDLDVYHDKEYFLNMNIKIDILII